MKHDDKDWFRSSRWDADIAAAFEARLRRARPDSRQQYIRIQGIHLVGQDEPALREVGRSLLRRAAYDERTPYDFGQTAAMEQLADSLLREGRDDEAEPILRDVLTRMKTAGRSGTSIAPELTLAELLLARGDEASLVEAAQALSEAEEHVQRAAFFRDNVLRFLVCRARVSSARGDGMARVYAAEALSISRETSPSIPNHPDLGRPNASPSLLAELELISKRFT
jgi:hypothetical protein